MSVTSAILWDHQGQKSGLFVLFSKLGTYCVLIICRMDGWDGAKWREEAAIELATKDMNLNLRLVKKV